MFLLRTCLVSRAGLLASLALLVLVPGVALSQAAPSEPPAREPMRFERGTVVQRQVVAVGRDLTIDGTARESAVAIGGRILVTGEVEGDVIALGGSVTVAPGARIGGDVCALGGDVELGEGAQIGGRSLAYPDAPSAFLLLLEGPALGLSPMSPVVVAAKLSLIAVWMLVALALLRFFPRPLRDTVETVSEEPFRCFFAGLTASLAGVMVVVLLMGVMAPIVGVPLVALVGLVALLLKLWGLVAVFAGCGRWLLQRLPGRSPLRAILPVQATLVGLVVLSLVKLLPYMGTWAWTVVSLVGIGAALLSRFGQDVPSPV